MGEVLHTKAFIKHKDYRLLFAVAGAFCVHFLVFWLLHTGVWWNVEPAHEARVITLSLVSGEMNQMRESDASEQATQNQMAQLHAKSVSPRADDGALSAAARLNAQGQHVPSPEPNDVDSIIHQETNPVNKASNASPAGVSQAAELQSSALASMTSVLDVARSVSDTELLHTTLDGGIAIAADRESVLFNPAESFQITESEQRMLDQKLQHWAQEFSDSQQVGALQTWQELGQTYEARFTRLPASDDMSLEQVAVEVRTQRNGETLRTSMRLQKLAFSNFGQFVHRWDPSVSMHDDEVSGRFHSNSRFNLDYSRQTGTIFADKVTTAAREVNFSGPASKQQVFQGGLETGVRRIAMPQPALLFENNDGVSSDAADTHFIEHDTSMRFLANGTVELVPSRATNQSIETVTLAEDPAYFIAAPNVALGVQGVVNGAVAVYSPNKIVIEGNLTYSSDAALGQGGDFLGLISARNIVIAGRKRVGRGDLEIHAALYARNRFVVTQAEGRRVGTLRVFGSLSAGSVSITEPRYATRIEFDRRLEQLRPPGFPVTSRYELAAKQQGWHTQTESEDWRLEREAEPEP